MFGTTPQQQALPVDDGFSVSHFLLNEHEMFLSFLWMAFGELLGCNDQKQMNQLKGFAFDCLLEYLDSKFSRIFDFGFRTCTKLPSSMTKEILITDIIDEVKKWTQFVGLIPDELIEWDMSHSMDTWMCLQHRLKTATILAKGCALHTQISNPKRREVHLGLVLKVDSQGHKPIMGRSQLICTGGSLMVTVQYSNDYKDDKNEEMESSKETGCQAPKEPVLCINDYDFFGSAATMNMCSKCQKDMILLKQEHAKLAAAYSKDVVCRSSSSDELELSLASSVVASVDLSSQISQVKSKEGLKKCTACRKRVGLTGFSCKYGDLFCTVRHYSDKHNCPFDYRNAGENAIAKANPIIIAEKLNKI
ncbi:Zinc finger A20 and AN1 domain-containing stress-associated protein 8 [Capsicum baccatum]|uniref:Zinc finger A20 and AN1 domain-containing stress-associated protein 8 n=1 Tax=Capsicum baccatum TaxID=33114 RepID=A0A2G2VDU5_CAPBA|nr:Zinc finger A20 and AN1 domain-containing stress-associated protein 8 [Capsicum baccatum]